MKSLVKILSLVTFFVISTVVFTATAFAADAVMMYGKTTPVLISGVNNAGTIWFQNDGATVYLPDVADQRAKLVPDPAVPGGYKIEGWAWSDNLGWVSFSCRGGKNPPTTGAACGDFDYSVKIDAAGVFHGYAWNDAMGYISFNSENHVPPALDGFGKPIVYGLKMSTTGAISGYAWSQSLGWLNFGGVYARIKIEVSPITNTPEQCPSGNTVGLCGCFGSGDPSGDPSKLNPTLDAGVPGAVKIADGVDKYILSLYFKDENGSLITADKFGAAGQYEAKVFFNWEDTIRREQTKKETLDYDGNKVAYPFKTSGSKGAVISKPVLLFTTATSAAADILFGDVSSNEAGTLENSKEALAAMTFNISSVAPTSKGNVSKIEGKTGTVSNDDLSLVPGFADASLFKDANRLKLTSIEWVILNKNTGVTINGTSSFDDKHGTLEFKPALEVSKMTNSLSANTLWMFRNVPVGVKIAVKNNKTKPEDETIREDYLTTLVKLVVGQSLENKFDTGFTASTTEWIGKINDAAGWTQDLAKDKYISTFFSTFTPQLEDNFRLEASIPDLGDLPGNYSEGAGLYSVIEYDAYASNPKKLVTYFSNHLPRTISAGVANPSVVIQGTTYSQGNEVSSPQAGVSITGIGDQNVNIVRDLVFENIQKLLMGQDLPVPQENPLTITNLNPSCTLAGGCLKVQLEKERIFYFDAPNLILNSGNDDIDIGPADMNTVIIVSGGDIHIESNLYTADSTKKQNKLGLVALRESSLGEGNFYISPFVTNIQALMIADGTMFSAPKGLFETIDGEPKDPIDPAVFNRQLVIEGGVSSRNCIGCVDSAKEFYYIPTRGPLSTDDVANKETAKKYDLNYLRYFSPSILYDDTGNPVDMKCGEALGIDQLQSPPAGCNGVTPTKMYDAITGDGDLVIQDEKTIAEGVKYDKKTADGKEVFFTKTSNPVYIKYVPPSADSFVFSKNKSLTF